MHLTPHKKNIFLISKKKTKQKKQKKQWNLIKISLVRHFYRSLSPSFSLWQIIKRKYFCEYPSIIYGELILPFKLWSNLFLSRGKENFSCFICIGDFTGLYGFVDLQHTEKSLASMSSPTAKKKKKKKRIEKNKKKMNHLPRNRKEKNQKKWIIS